MSKKVSIEVGHGGKDPGAAANGFRESDINLVVALELERQLKRHGVDVLISRTSDCNDLAADFLPKVQLYKPDVHVSVHTNAGGGEGFEVYKQTNNLTTASYKLCTAIEKYVKEAGQNSRGIKTCNFLMLSIPHVAAYLELGFVDNKKDLAKFDTAEKQKNFAIAYAKGILEYLGIAWVKEAAVGFKVGDKVKVTGAYAGSANNSKATSSAAVGSERYITQIYSGFDFPYRLGVVKGDVSVGNTTGFAYESGICKV